MHRCSDWTAHRLRARGSSHLAWMSKRAHIQRQSRAITHLRESSERTALQSCSSLELVLRKLISVSLHALVFRGTIQKTKPCRTTASAVLLAVNHGEALPAHSHLKAQSRRHPRRRWEICSSKSLQLNSRATTRMIPRGWRSTTSNSSPPSTGLKATSPPSSSQVSHKGEQGTSIKR